MPRMLSSLRVRLVLLVLIAMVPAFGLILWSSFDVRQSQREHSEENATSLAQTIANQQGQFVEGTRQMLGMLAGLTAQSLGSAESRPVDSQACGRAFAGILERDVRYANMGILAADGSVLCSGVESTTPTSAADRPWFQEAVATKKFSIGEYQIGRISGKKSIAFGDPIVDANGEVRAVLFASVDLDWLNAEAAKIELPENAAFRVVDRNGVYLVRYPDSEAYVGTTAEDIDLIDRAFATGGSLGERNGPDGVERLYASAPVRDVAERDLLVSAGLSTDELYGPLDRALWRNLGLLGGVTVLALIAAWFLGDALVVQHLRVLGRAANRVRGGDLTARTELRGGPIEVVSLGRSFDEMAQTLQQRDIERDHAEAALRQSNAELGRSEAQLRETNAALVRSESTLQQSNEDLMRSNEELEQFAYVASHDLQEPLRMVGNYTQLLARRYKGQLDSDADDFINYAVEGAKRMQELINDLLAFSRVGSRGKELEAGSAEAMLKNAMVNLTASIEERGAVVTNGPLPDVMADDVQLTQVFQNLIGNAMKFQNGAVPEIQVSSERRGDEWLFSVHDNGIGIAPEYHDRIFIIFQRLHSREEYQGTGMGLAICKKIVERHGGRIWVESMLGEGATFYFTLPVIEARAQAA